MVFITLTVQQKAKLLPQTMENHLIYQVLRIQVKTTLLQTNTQALKM